jgi:anti-sigma-K factor RskA
MDIQKYIASGILEQYVLGDLSASQQEEVERYAAQYPEIRKEIESIEAALESYGQLHAIEPPQNLESKILEKISAKQAGGSVSHSGSKPVSKVWLGLALAAACTGLVIAYSQHLQLEQTRQELSSLQEEYKTLDQNCSEQLKQKVNTEAFIALLRDGSTKAIVMQGTENAPNSLASVYWNEAQQKTFLELSNMPQTPAGKQYQLWAIVDGKPVDMGVFNGAIGSEVYMEVPFIQAPQAFAVTVEKEGGNPTPTLETMVVIGNVS